MPLALVKKIQSMARTHGGNCTFPFSQAIPPISHLIGTNQKTKDGFCKALTDHWILCHAKGDSLWNEVYRDVNGQPCFMINGIKELMALQSSASGIDQQIRQTEQYLAKGRIINRAHPKSGIYAIEGGDTNIARNARQIANRIADWSAGTGCYLSITMLSKRGNGHATSAFVGLREVCYFDPNLGEYWFDNKDNFKNWFMGAWNELYLSRNYKFYGHYLYAYAKRVHNISH